MLFYIVTNWQFGLWIQSARSSNIKKHNVPKILLAAILAIDIGVLFYFKYFVFFMTSIGKVLSIWGDIGIVTDVHLPIGISFFAFQAISYVIDIYRGDTAAQRSLIAFGAYKSMFPQLIAGPIVRYRTVASQILDRPYRQTEVIEGISRFVLGLSKKVLIANNLAIFSSALFSSPAEQLTAANCWFGVVCYGLQIFFDFSGYSDMAIGLGKILGFHFEENFDRPYVSRSVKEFWRRWHISLSSWFRDYVYISLGGNRVGVSRGYLNLVLVFVLCGFWHGAHLNFLAWGLWHGIFLVFERTKLGSYVNRLPSFLGMSYTLFVVFIGWVFFRSENLTYAFQIIQTMFFLRSPTQPTLLAVDYTSIFWVCIGIIASSRLIASFRNSLLTLAKDRRVVSTLLRSFQVVIFTLLFLLSSANIAMDTFNPFIYFQF